MLVVLAIGTGLFGWSIMAAVIDAILLARRERVSDTDVLQYLGGLFVHLHVMLAGMLLLGGSLLSRTPP